MVGVASFSLYERLGTSASSFIHNTCAANWSTSGGAAGSAKTSPRVIVDLVGEGQRHRIAGRSLRQRIRRRVDLRLDKYVRKPKIKRVSAGVRTSTPKTTGSASYQIAERSSHLLPSNFSARWVQGLEAKLAPIVASTNIGDECEKPPASAAS